MNRAYRPATTPADATAEAADGLSRAGKGGNMVTIGAFDGVRRRRELIRQTARRLALPDGRQAMSAIPSADTAAPIAREGVRP